MVEEEDERKTTTIEVYLEDADYFHKLKRKFKIKKMPDLIHSILDKSNDKEN